MLRGRSLTSTCACLPTAVHKDGILNSIVTVGTFFFNGLLRGSKRLEQLLPIIYIGTLHQCDGQKSIKLFRERFFSDSVVSGGGKKEQVEIFKGSL
jgi:hypothetical protein